jgi:hypothetical protein
MCLKLITTTIIHFYYYGIIQITYQWFVFSMSRPIYKAFLTQLVLYYFKLLLLFIRYIIVLFSASMLFISFHSSYEINKDLNYYYTLLPKFFTSFFFVYVFVYFVSPFARYFFAIGLYATG